MTSQPNAPYTDNDDCWMFAGVTMAVLKVAGVCALAVGIAWLVFR